MAALNTGPDSHLLDHIAPLAALKNIPLIVTEEENYQLATKYYPEVQIRHAPEFNYKELAGEFETLYECKYWRPEIKETFRLFYRKEMQLVFCPHGQSDKGYRAPLLVPYAMQDKVLLYGNLQKQMLAELNIPLQSYEIVGNYRYEHFKKHRDRYRKLADVEIFSHLNSANKTLLYAPTWQDADQSTTFFAYAKKLLSELPPHWNLILKIHPLLESRDPVLYYRLLDFQNRSNFLLVDQFPLIYPILERIDAYLGDYSSIGYDVLAFRKPMFFLLHDRLPLGRLHACGTILNPEQNIFESLGTRNQYESIQEKLYNLAFHSIAIGGRT